MNKDTGMSSKLNALLRLGLVSKNNVRRALYVMQNPEQAMKSASYRTLIQELLIDVVDRILNNKSLYNLVRQNLVKDSSSSVNEDVSDERTKTLLRSGLVKKKDIILARKALSSKKNFKQMSQVGVYRELMIDMLDSMAKKITGNPVLFNAFKRTMGDQQADESFEMPNAESIMEFGLNKDFTELLESHKPNNTKLWVESKKKAKGKFDTCPCEKCEEAWAMKWYNEHDGEWTPIAEGKSFFGFMDQVDEVLTPKQKKIDINKNKRLDAQDFKALRTAKVAEETTPRRGATLKQLDAEKIRDYRAAQKFYEKDMPNQIMRARLEDRKRTAAKNSVKEEIEQVDELSKGLLKRYKAAATVNADNLEKEGDRYSRNVQHGNLTPKQKKLSMKIRSRMYGKSDERRFKIAQAERKLGEDVEQIDESINESLSVPEQHLLKIARKTVKMNPIMSNAMGGISIKQSHEFLLKNGTSAEKMAAKKYLSVKEDVEQVDEAGQAKLYRMRYSHGRAWRRGDKKKQDAMGVATYDKQTKEDAKDLNRTGSAFGMRVKRLAGNRKAMGYSESTLIGKQKKLDVNKNKRLDAEDFKVLRTKIRKGIK